MRRLHSVVLGVFLSAPAVVSAQARLATRPAPSAAPATPFTPTEPAPNATRTAMVVVGTGSAVTLSRLSPTDATLTPLTFRPPTAFETNRGFGSEVALSPDGSRLALLRNNVPFVVDVATGAEQRIFAVPRPRDLDFRFIGWSPRGTRLAYRVAEPGSMEGPSHPTPVPVGVYTWAGPGTQPARLTHAPLTDTVYWAADGAAMLAHAFVAQSNYELRRVPLDNTAPTLLSAARLPYGYAQLHPVGDSMVYMRSEPGPQPGSVTGSYVAAQALDGTGLRRLAPDAPFATDQRPAFSPDRAHYAYTHGAEIMVGEVSAGAPRPAYRCRTACTLYWESPARLLVLDGPRLLRVPLEGPAVELLGANVRAVIVAGDG